MYQKSIPYYQKAGMIAVLFDMVRQSSAQSRISPGGIGTSEAGIKMLFELIAEGSGLAPQTIRQHRLRPPIKPVSLQELANAKVGETDES